MDKNLKVKFKIANVIEFEAEGMSEDVERERAEFLNKILLAAISAVSQTQTIMPSREAVIDISQTNNELLEVHEISELSINEFLNQKGFASQIDMAIGLIYYKQTYCNCTDFNSEELKNYFSDAKTPAPKNPSDTIGKLVGKSYIMNAESKGRYKLTRTGIQYVVDYKKQDIGSKGKKKVSLGTTKKSVASKEVYQMNKDLDLLPNDKESFKSFYEMKKPTTNIEFNAVAIYYMEKILGKVEITISDVYTCYKNVGRKVPNALKQSLTDTSSSRYGYIATANNCFTIPVVGENFVEYDLTKKAKDNS